MSDVTVSVDLLRETESALLVSDGDHAVWLPKSLATYDVDDRSVTLPEWLAIREELV